jgi:hypothetical protein
MRKANDHKSMRLLDRFIVNHKCGNARNRPLGDDPSATPRPLLNQATECSVSSGAIALQSEGGEFEARKVTIEPLPPATTNTPSR